MNSSVSESSLIANLLERLSTRENLELEFKLAKGGLPKSLWPTVSAFANTSGGWIVLGVDDTKFPVEIIGVPNADARLQDFFNVLNNQQKVSRRVCGPTDASTEMIGEKEIIVIRVPATPVRERPIFIDNNPYKGTYVRGHTGDFLCGQSEVNRMMREASERTADSAIVDYLSIDDLDLQTLRVYRQRFQNNNPGSPFNGLQDLQFLEAIDAYRLDRSSGNAGITVAGLLLLGTSKSIRHWRGRHLIDYRLVLDSDSWDHRWDDRLVCEGNLLEVFDLVYPRLTANLPIGFRLEGPRRTDQSPIHIALREALVNAIVHADYAETQPTLIIQDSDGYIIRNPGTSRIPVADLGVRHDSDPRNPLIVRMFRHIGLADEAGSGMAKIFGAWRESRLFPPSVEIDTERYEFSLFMPYVRLFPDEDLAWLESLGTRWSENEQMALVHTKHRGYVDNRSLCRLVNIHPADATKVLGGLRDRGVLTMTGWARGTRYELSDLARMTAGPQMPNVWRTTLQDNGLPIEDSQTSMEDSKPTIEDNAPTLEDNLRATSQPARDNRRLETAYLDQIIVKLCSLQPLSVKQIARWVDRNETYIGQRIRPLVRERMLSQRFPDMPRHPKQTYYATGTTRPKE